MADSPKSKPQFDEIPHQKTWTRRRCFLLVSSAALLGMSCFLWWRTTHIDEGGRLPKPAMAITVPGGLLQGWARPDGLHLIGMGRGHRIAVLFEPATHLGNAGYHFGNPRSFGGFTFAMLTKTVHDLDYIVSPYVALVIPYWFLILLGTLGIACSVRLVDAIRGRFKTLAARPTKAPMTTAAK